MEDVAHSAAKGLIGLIPAGSVVTEILAQFFAPPLEKRRDEWLKKIAEVLAELQRDRGVPVEKLGEDQAFVTLVLQATQVALRNHHQKKLDSLRNAISRGYGPDVNDDELHLFIRLIRSSRVFERS